MRIIRSIASCLVAGVAAVATAQTMPVRLRGAITAIDDKTVTIATREGTTVNIKLADNWSVNLVVPASLADIKPGAFVGVGSLGSDADRTALEVLVFPDAMKSSNEGHYPGTCSRAA